MQIQLAHMMIKLTNSIIHFSEINKVINPQNQLPNQLQKLKLKQSQKQKNLLKSDF
jgi:hypothetical protein